MSSQGTRRSSILKRRQSGGERLILFIKRFGLFIGVATFLFWAGSWVMMSGAALRFQQGVENSLLNKTATWGFAVKNIMVDGRKQTDADALRAVIAMEPGDPIFAFDPDAAKQTLEKLSWVKSAHVERRLPDTIYIRLSERTPIALWQRNQKLSLIDADGVVLTDQNLEPYKNFLIVVGDDAPQKTSALLEMLHAEPLIEKRVEAATLVSSRRWDLKLKSGAEVKLPEEELGLALRSLAANHEQEALLDKDVLSIDVRDEGRITVRTKPGAAQDFGKDLNATITPAAGSPI